LEPAETKKQRQNRRKAEERKAAREEAEKHRRVLLEKQLRTAREAEGRPAKNGLGVTSKPPAKSAWTSTSTSVGVDSKKEAAENVSLLDTFDSSNRSEDASLDGPTSSSTSDTGNSKSTHQWEQDLPSEEEQMRIIKEQEDDAGWNTVGKSRKKKKATDSEVSGNESSDKSHTVNGPSATPAISISKGTVGKAASDAVLAPVNQLSKPEWAVDSDWAVV